MIDLSSILQGATAGWLTNKTQSKIDEAVSPDEPFQHSTDDYIKEIHHVLVSLAAFLKEKEIQQSDIFKFVTLYKSGLGSPFRPNATVGRQNMQILSTVSVTLNVNISGLPSFNLSLSPGVWTDINFPDGTTYIVDSGYTSNSVGIYARNTGESTV